MAGQLDRRRTAPCELKAACAFLSKVIDRADAISALANASGSCWIIPLTGWVYANGTRADPGECLYLSEPALVSAAADSSALVAAS